MSKTFPSTRWLSPLRLICLAGLACLAMRGAGDIIPDRKPHQTAVPQIARLAGVTVGISTMEELGRRFGLGQAMVGGHPHGARGWYSKQTGWFIYADGFDYSQRGRVVYSLSVSAPEAPAERDASTPKTCAPARTLAFLGGLVPGMSRRQVLRALKGKLPVSKPRADVMTWRMPGWVRVDRNIVYRTWTARIIFRHQRLASIRVDCA